MVTDYYTFSDSKFTPSQATNDGVGCDAIYFYAFTDQALTTTWSDSDIVLSAADVVDTANNLTPDQTALSLQTLTINTASPFRKQLYIKGLNSGREFGEVETNVIVCGNEAVT